MPYFSFDKIKIGPITIYVLGAFIALGFLIGLILILKEKGKYKKIVIDSFAWLLLGAIIGSRLGYIFQHFNYYLSNLAEVVKVWEGGMTFHGGLFGLIIAGLLYIKIKKLSYLDFLQTADLIVLTAPLGIAIGRIGCLLINDHQGSLAPFGIVWPDGTTRNPVAWYLIIANLIIFLILKRIKSKRPGSLLVAFLVLYSIARFFLDFTRSTLHDPRYWSLTWAQWLSLAIILVVIVSFRRK